MSLGKLRQRFYSVFALRTAIGRVLLESMEKVSRYRTIPKCKYLILEKKLDKIKNWAPNFYIAGALSNYVGVAYLAYMGEPPCIIETVESGVSSHLFIFAMDEPILIVFHCQ